MIKCIAKILLLKKKILLLKVLLLITKELLDAMIHHLQATISNESAKK